MTSEWVKIDRKIMYQTARKAGFSRRSSLWKAWQRCLVLTSQ